MPRLTLTPDTLGPIRRGHPWVYRDGVKGSAPPGAVVELAAPEGKVVAWGLADEGPIAVRVLGLGAGARGGPDLGRALGEGLRRAQALRDRVVGGETDTYRVLNGEGDGLGGLVLDRYGELAVLRVYARGWEPHLDAVVEAVRALGWPRTVFRRLGVDRVDGAEGGHTLWGPEAPRQLVVREHGLRFLVRPYEGQKTGLFLDQREHRRQVGELARGLEVVNLFAYNGGFSVYAAAGGARRVTSVDLAGPALEDARENFRLNGLDPSAHRFEKADIFQWSLDGRAELLVNDPPSLTHRRDADSAARTAYRDLNARVGAWVAKDGLLATASCSARLSLLRWEEAVREGLRKVGRWSWLGRSEAPPDHPVGLEHPEGRYLKWGLLRRDP